MFIFCALFLGAFLNLGSHAIGAESPVDYARLRVMADGYRANRAAFTLGKCRFTYSILTANNERDAIAGKWSAMRQSLTSERALYFQGDRMALRTEIDQRRVAAALQNSSAIITPDNYGIKGGYAIDHDGLINSAIVYSPGNKGLNVRIHPFNLAADAGGIDPASGLAYAESKKFDGIEMTVQESVVRDGKEYLLVKITSKGNSHDAHYYIDPQRGNLPFITEHYSKQGTRELHSRMLLLDVHQENKAYFPMRAIQVTFRRPAGKPEYVQVREMKVTELDLKYQPTKDDFTLRLPKETQYSDGVHPNTAKTLFRGIDGEFALVSIDEIEGIYKQLMELAKEREKDAAANQNAQRK